MEQQTYSVWRGYYGPPYSCNRKPIRWDQEPVGKNLTLSEARQLAGLLMDGEKYQFAFIGNKAPEFSYS